MIDTHAHLSSRDFDPDREAVLLTGYELLMARLRADPQMPALKPRQTRASRPDHLSQANEQEEVFSHLRAAFLEIGYAQPHTVDSLMRSYREIFSRARLFRREAHMIRGLARQMQWCARQARQWQEVNEETWPKEKELKDDQGGTNV